MNKGIEVSGKVLESCNFDQFTIRRILELYRKGVLNLSPEFQRSGVWNVKDRSKLIDTIFSGYPLPAVILYERTDTRLRKTIYDVIDGKQRLETILYFIGALSGPANKFEARIASRVDGEISNLRVHWTDLAETSKRDFLDYEIPCVIVKGEPSDIQEVFVRINSTGKKLTSQEQRNAKYIKSPFLREMKKFVKKHDKTFVRLNVLNENDIARMKDIEFASELIISSVLGTVLDKKNLLDQMMTPNGIDMRLVPSAEKDVAFAIDIIGKLPGIKETRFIKLSDFYSLVFWFANRHDTIVSPDSESLALASELLRKFAVMADCAYNEIKAGKLKQDDAQVIAYVQSVREGGDAKSHRKERDHILSEILKGVFEKKDKQRLFSEIQRRIIWGTTEKHECYICHRELEWGNFEIDHVKAHSKGGKTDIPNSALICRSCNSAKGNRAISNYATSKTHQNTRLVGISIDKARGDADCTNNKINDNSKSKESWKGRTQLAKIIARRGGNEGAFGGILQYFAGKESISRKPCSKTSKWRKPLEQIGIRFDNDDYVIDWTVAKNPL